MSQKKYFKTKSNFCRPIVLSCHVLLVADNEEGLILGNSLIQLTEANSKKNSVDNCGSV
jgi:hypothetical protein